MIRFRHVDMTELARNYGVFYFFEKVGDALPPHIHPPEEDHTVLVLQGRAIVRYPTMAVELAPGESFMVDGRIRHSVAALEPNTATFHGYVNGRPSFYDGLAKDNFEGTLGG